MQEDSMLSIDPATSSTRTRSVLLQERKALRCRGRKENFTINAAAPPRVAAAKADFGQRILVTLRP